MKLLNKTNIYISIANILLLLVSIAAVYWLILKKIDKEQNEHLLADKSIVIDLLKEGKTPSIFSANVGEKISITEIPVQTLFQNVFRDYDVEEKEHYIADDGATEEEDGEGDESVTHRELLFQANISNKYYEIKISHSLSEGKETGEYIASAILIFLIFLLLEMFLLKREYARY